MRGWRTARHVYLKDFSTFSKDFGALSTLYVIFEKILDFFSCVFTVSRCYLFWTVKRFVLFISDLRV